MMVKISWKWNVPNVLSLFRLALVPCIAVTYMREKTLVAVIALIVSGLTDVVDGFVARHFNQITDVGKILDPLADKLTQMTVALCLTIRNLALLPLLVICVAKELCQMVGGLLLLGKGSEVRGSKWFGKLSTVLFYTVAVVLVQPFCVIPHGWQMALVGVVLAAMLLAFFSYLAIFIQMSRDENTGETE